MLYRISIGLKILSQKMSRYGMGQEHVKTMASGTDHSKRKKWVLNATTPS